MDEETEKFVPIFHTDPIGTVLLSSFEKTVEGKIHHSDYPIVAH